MNPETSPGRRAEVRPIVSAVLHQIMKLRAGGGMSQETFEAQIARLSAEELWPRGQSLLVRELRDGHTRFIIKDRDGTVCELIDCQTEIRAL